MSRLNSTTLGAAASTAFFFCTLLPLEVAAQPAGGAISVFTVNQNSDENQAVWNLRSYFATAAELRDQGVTIDTAGENTPTYGNAIREAVAAAGREERYIARLTPYVYVVAQMLGANVDILATYISKSTQSATYHSYFVVNQSVFSEEPSLTELVDYIEQRDAESDPLTFIYHNQFSTSSFLLPALYFREHRIFHASGDDEDLTSIKVEQITGGSSELVRQVAAGSADLAAVWDGTKAGFDEPVDPGDAGIDDQVYFIEIPVELPNDLLVASPSLDSEEKEAIRDALRAIDTDASDELASGDVQRWVDFEDTDANDARRALPNLRRQAAAPPIPVPVRVIWENESAPEGSGIAGDSLEATQQADQEARRQEILEATEQAIRVAGTELVVWDSSYTHWDVQWSVKMLHDNAIQLTSTFTDFLANDDLRQEFQISFTDPSDIAARIPLLIHSRLPRIRHVWPYLDSEPTVIRDIQLNVPAGQSVTVQQITWTNPERNTFVEGRTFSAEVETSGLYTFTLSGESDFPGGTVEAFDFDPMSNEAYRVVLVRPTQERSVFVVLTVVYIGLVTVAAVGLFVDLRRKARRARIPPPDPQVSFEQTYARRLDDYHRHWGAEHAVTDVNLLWCHRARIEALISDLKAGGLKPDFDKEIRRRDGIAWSAGASLLNKAGATFERSLIRELIVDPTKVGNAKRLGDVIRFLVNTRQLSPFVGQPLEWEVLNEMAGSLFEQREGNERHAGQHELLRPDDRLVAGLASQHFTTVMHETDIKVSFFALNWNIAKDKRGYLLSREVRLPTGLTLESERETVTEVRVEFNLPDESELSSRLTASTLDAWHLGNLVGRPVVDADGGRRLTLHFRAIAVVLGGG